MATVILLIIISLQLILVYCMDRNLPSCPRQITAWTRIPETFARFHCSHNGPYSSFRNPQYRCKRHSKGHCPEYRYSRYVDDGSSEILGLLRNLFRRRRHKTLRGYVVQTHHTGRTCRYIKRCGDIFTYVAAAHTADSNIDNQLDQQYYYDDDDNQDMINSLSYHEMALRHLNKRRRDKINLMSIDST